MTDIVSRLRELHARATPGPWGDDNWGLVVGDDWETPVVHCKPPLGIGGERDVELIVAMRNALPALLDVVEAAQAYLENDGMGPDATPEEYLAACGAEAELHAALEALRKEEM